MRDRVTDLWPLLLVGVGVLVVAALVWRAVSGGRRRAARLADFERDYGLSPSSRTTDLGTQYVATGTLGDLDLEIETETLRTARGMRRVTWVRARGPVDAGQLHVLRRTVPEQNAASTPLPEQRLDDPEIDPVFRVLAPSVEQARLLQQPAVREPLLKAVGPMASGIHALKISGTEISVVLGLALAAGMNEQARALMDDALALVRACAPGSPR